MIIGGKNFDTANHTYIMGILNVTPDSFSDGGKFNGMDAAIAHAHQMVEEGADIIDVGGESTRPGHIQITDEEEIARVTPIIEVLKKEFDVPVSIDTYKSHVAEAALQAGADLVNDIWGLKYDKKMASVIAKYQAACCLMHNREKAEYQDFLKDFIPSYGSLSAYDALSSSSFCFFSSASFAILSGNVRIYSSLAFSNSCLYSSYLWFISCFDVFISSHKAPL